MILANTPIRGNSIRIKYNKPTKYLSAHSQANKASLLLMGVSPQLTASILLWPNAIFAPKQGRVEITRKEGRKLGMMVGTTLLQYGVDSTAHGKTCI
jgi:preprotein translocase subunit SecY